MSDLVRLHDLGLHTRDEFLHSMVIIVGRLASPAYLPQMPPELLRELEERLNGRLPLMGVGYWAELTTATSTEEDPFPDPRRLVRPDWRSGERCLIADYLRSGRPFRQYRGISYCRFRCGESDMGSRCLTDGEWVWPEGLAHYVEAHSVCLPDDFVGTMCRHEWHVPPPGSEPYDRKYCDSDQSSWVTWGRAVMSGDGPEPVG